MGEGGQIRFQVEIEDGNLCQRRVKYQVFFRVTLTHVAYVTFYEIYCISHNIGDIGCVTPRGEYTKT